MESILNPIKTSISKIQAASINSVAYDPTICNMITIDKTKLNILEIAKETSTSFEIPSSSSPAPASDTLTTISGKSVNDLNADRLRFISSNADSKMSITQFGNVLTSYSKKPQNAIANFGFSQGIHYWEIICPNKCTGIEVGVVKEGWTLPESTEIKNEYVFFEFNTSTTRTICIKLDLINLEVSAWIKSNRSKVKKFPISRNKWFPCVRINEIGNVAILNTRACEPGAKPIVRKSFVKSYVKKALSRCVIVIGKEESNDSPAKDQSSNQFQPKLNNIRAYSFLNDQELEEFKNSVLPQELIESEIVKTWGYKIIKGEKLEIPSDPSLQKAQEWFWENFSNVIASAKLENQTLAEKVESLLMKISKLDKTSINHSVATEPEDFQVSYIQASDSLLVIKGELMKLITKTDGKFDVNDIFSFSRPYNPKDEIQLFLDINPLKLLLEKVTSTKNFVQLTKNHPNFVGFERFLSAIELSFTEGKIYSHYLAINIVYKYAKRAIDTFTLFLENSLHWVRSIFKSENEMIETAICKDTNEDELLLLMNFVASIDESLFAMIHHEEANEKLFAYWQSTTSRVFTSFDRIETLSSLPDLQYNIIKLSDIGLYNQNYLNYEFKYNLDEELPIDSAKVLKASSPFQVEAYLKENKNIFAKETASSFKNVPLSVTLNNLPPQIHDNKTKNILISEEIPYIVSVSQKGEINLWNTKKALVFLCKSDFTKPLEKKKPILFQKKDKPAVPINPVNQGGLFGGDGFGVIPANQTLNQNLFQEPEELDEENQEEVNINKDAGMGPTGFGFGAPTNPFAVSSTGGMFGGGFAASANFSPFGSTGSLFQTKPPANKQKDLLNKLNQKLGNTPIKKKQQQSGAKQEVIDKEETEKIPSKEHMKKEQKVESMIQKKHIESEEEKEKEQEKQNKNEQNKEKEEPKNQLVGESLQLPAKTGLTFGEILSEKSNADIKSDIDQKVSQGFGFSSNVGFPFGGGNAITYEDYVEDWEDIPGENLGDLQPSPFSFPIPVMENKSPQKASLFIKDKNPVNPEEAEVNNLEGCAVTGNIIVPLKNSPLSPLVVGLCFKKDKNCILRLRRFAYSPAYIKKFFYKHPTEGLYSLINSKLFDTKDFEGIQRHLTQEHELVFSSLEPLIFSKYRYRNKTNISQKFIQSEWIDLDETDVQLPFEDVLTFTVLPCIESEHVEDSRKVFAIGKKDNQLEACLITIKNTKKNPYDADYSKEKSFSVGINITKTSDMPALEGQRIIAFGINKHILVFQIGQSVAYILDQNLEFVKSSELGFEVRDAKLLAENMIGFLDNNLNIQLCKYNSGLEAELPAIKRSISSQEYLQDIIKSPFEHLDEILDVLQGSITGEKIEAIKCVPAYDSSFSSSIKLNQNEKYSRIIIELNFANYIQNHIEEKDEELKKLLHQFDTKKVLEISKQGEKDQKKLSETQTEFPLFERTSLDPGSLKYLPIIAHQVKGGVFSQLLPATCMTIPSTEVFASKYPDAEFVFKHLHDKVILVASITLASPIQPTGLGAYPLASGFIYLIDDISALYAIAQPDVTTEEEFKAWCQRKKESGSRLKSTDPAGFFELGDLKQTYNFELAEKRPARFIVLKPLKLRNEGRILNAKEYPVEIGFFGIHGFALENEIITQKNEDSQNDKHYKIPINLRIEAKIEEKWQILSNIPEVTVKQVNNGFDHDLLKIPSVLAKLPLSLKANIDISHELLDKNKVTEARILISPQNKENLWRLSSVSIQPVILMTKDSKLNYEVACKFKQDLVFQNKYETLLKIFVSNLCNNENSLEIKIKLAQILHTIIIFNPILKTSIFEALNLEKYIKFNILPETKHTSFHFLSLLRDLSSVDSFKSKIYQALSFLLPELSEVPNLTNNGIKTYFTLIYWSSPDTSTISALVSELKKLAKQVKESRIPGYKILRSQYNIPLMSFERCLFDEGFVLQMNETYPIEKVAQAEKAIRCKFLHKSYAESDEFLVDLQQTHDISQIKLWFPEHDKLSNLRVQIWSISNNQDNLIYSLLVSQYFNDSEGVWMHLTKQAHEPSLNKYFSDPEQLSALGFKVQERVRYLLVQITYSFRAGLPNINKDYNKKSIMPTVHGQPVEINNDAIESLVKRFDVKSSATFKNVVEVNSWLSYDKFDNIPEGSNIFLYEYSNESGDKKDSIIGDNEYELMTKLTSLQGELYNQLYKQRTTGYYFQNHDLTIDLCHRIQNIQIKLFNQSNEEKLNQKEGHHHTSLTLLLNLIQNISQYLLKALKNNSKISQNIFSPEEVKDIFDSLFLYESPSYLEQLARVIQTWVWPSFSHEEQKSIIKAIYESYLTSSISILHDPVDKLYPSLPVVDFLLKLIGKDLNHLTVFLEKLGEVSSLVGNTYALIIINEIYIKNVPDTHQELSEVSNRIHGQVLEALVRNLHYIIETPEFLETEKQYLVGFVVDIVKNVIYILEAKDLERLYNAPRELFRVFHYVTKNKMIIVEQNLMKILNLSCDMLIEKHNFMIGQSDTTRLKTVLANNNDKYVTFFLESLRELVNLAKNDFINSGETIGLEHFAQDITENEWRELVRIFMLHLYTILESDRKDRLRQQRAQLKKKKKISSEVAQETEKKENSSLDKHKEKLEDGEEEKDFELSQSQLILKEKSVTEEKKDEADKEKDEEIEDESEDDDEKDKNKEKAPQDIHKSKGHISKKPEFTEFSEAGLTLSKFTLDDSEAAGKDCMMLSQLILDLTSLLSRESKGKKGFNFSESNEHWLILLKTISMFKATDNFNNKIALKLIQSFFKASSDMKDYLHAFLGVIFKNFQSVSLETLAELTMFSTDLGSFENSELTKPMVANNLFLSTAFDRMKKIISSSSQEEKSQFPYNEPLLIKILTNMQDLLKKELNFGGKSGVTSCTESQTAQIQRICAFISLIDTSSKGDFIHPLSFSKLLSNYESNKEFIDSFVNTLTLWYMFNKFEGESTNPPIKALSTISKKVHDILQNIVTNEDTTRSALRCLLDNFSDILNTISDLTCKRIIKGHVSLENIRSLCSNFQEILSMWITSDKIADYFNREIKGFEYLLKILGFINFGVQDQPSLFFGHNEISQYFSKRFSKLNSEDFTFGELFNDAKRQLDADTTEEEFAKKVKIHRIKGQKWPKYTLDLTVSKNNMQKVLSFQIEGEEYCLCMEFEQVFEIKNLTLGIMDTNDLGLDNLAVMPDIYAEVGTAINDLKFVGKLRKESKFTNSQLFSCSFEGFNTPNSSEPEEWLKSTSNIRVKFLKLRFRKPVLKFFGGYGFTETKPYKNLIVNISFVSVSGVDISNYGHLTDQIKEIAQTASLKIIDKTSQDLPEAWKKLAEQDFYLKKDEKCLDAISNIMDINDSLATKILLSISKYNQNIGNWLFEQLLESPKVKKYSSLIGEIITNEPSRILARVERLNQFLIKEARRLATVKAPEQYTNDFEVFLEFVEILTTTILVAPQEDLSKDINVQLEVDYVKDLVHLYQKFSDLTTNAIKITKLIILCVFSPKPFVSKDSNILRDSLEFIYGIYQKEGEIDLLKLLSLIGIGSSQASKWLLDHIEKLFNEICKQIIRTPINQMKSLTSVFVFLNNIITTEVIKKKFLKEDWHLKLLNIFRADATSSTTIFKSNDSEVLQYLHTFLKNITMDFTEKEEELVKILKDDLTRLKENNDNTFLEHFFLPIIKAEPEIPVCFFPYDQSKKQWVSDLHSQTASTQELHLQSKLLKGENSKAFNTMFQKLSKKAGTYAKYCNMKWKRAFVTTQDGDTQMQKTINEKVSGKGPFLILFEGNSVSLNFNFGQTAPHTKKAYVGVFSGKPFPDISTPNNYYGIIEKSPDAFIFYYDDKSKLHFPISESLNKNLATINLFTGGGGLSVFYNNHSLIYLSLFPGQGSYCSIDLISIRPLEADNKHTSINVNTISNIEVWVLERGSNKSVAKMKTSNVFKTSNILRQDLFDENNALNFYRPLPIYNIPATISIDQLSSIFFKQKIPLVLKITQEHLENTAIVGEIHEFVKKDSYSQGIIDIEFDYNKFLEIKQITAFSGDLTKPNYSPNMTIFNAFKRNGGIETLLAVAMSNIEKWKKPDLKSKWIKWMSDLQNLSDFPNFFEAFIKNQESVELLFQILANKPDEEVQRSEEDLKKWEEKEIISHKYIYQALADSFRMVPSINACKLAIESNKFAKILEVLAIISKEKPRRWVEDPDEEERKESQQTSPAKKEKDDNDKKKPSKKKGVGYGSDYVGGVFQHNQKTDVWNVNEFVEKKKMKNEQLISLINVIASIFETKGWEPPSNVLKMICESALLPLLESAFRNGSLVDMGKESDLYFAYLRLVKTLSTHKSLIPCLLELERNYRPKQRDSVYSLLSHMNDISKIFISCLSNTDFKKEDEEKVKEPFGGTINASGGLFGDPLGGQANNDAGNAWKILNQPLMHSKIQFGFTNKEFIFQTAITTNNPDLVPQGGPGLGHPFGGGGLFGGLNSMQNANKQIEQKKVEKKPKPSVFSADLIKITEKKSLPPSDEINVEDANLKKNQKKNQDKLKKPKKASKATHHKSKKGKSKKKEDNSNEKDEEALQNERLAHEIIETFEFVKKEVTIYRATDISQSSIEDILKKSLPEAYRELLGGLRFDYMDMKEGSSGKFKHYYGHMIAPSIPPQAKMIRLAQELADLSNSLPHEHTNAIFVRVDRTKVDLMKVLIMGSSSTPYAHGAFEYDVYFDDSYPNSPPKVNLMTTGGGSVRFNPNLYANGKVCLSLLGTWSGRGGENWNPKLSTFLQVLLSIQSLIMTEDIYYNEPGLEVYAGTPQGELENEGYSNVVRYCNVKYAMLDQLRHPSKGFETVIKRHFYLKKKEIMDEVKQWIQLAKTKDAQYNGCQNYNWQHLFNQSKTKYHDMLVEIAAELEEELNKLPPPTDTELESPLEVKRTRKVKIQEKEDNDKPTEEIDVTYDKEIKMKDLDVTDDTVRDRWSRYIGAMGIEAVAKQASSTVFLTGLGSLGVEIAKNIALSGVKRLTLHDDKKVAISDLAGQFFLEEEDIGKNRVIASLTKLQQLNFYVKIDIFKLDESLPKQEQELEIIGLQNYNLIISTETDRETVEALDKFCRKRGIGFITADVYGLFSRVFCDFGDEFLVVDKDGEEPREVLIKSITNEEKGLVTLLETNKHNFEDGNEVLITEVIGMDNLNNAEAGSINTTKHKIQVENAYSFRIGDTRHFSTYKLNGKAKLIKNPVIVKFKSFEETLKSPISSLDQNLAISDFSKSSHSLIAHIMFESLEDFKKLKGKIPKPWNVEDSNDFLKLANLHKKKFESEIKSHEEFEKIAKMFSHICSGVFSPLVAFVGGFVSQEAIKALTNKFMPINQLFYTDCTELVPSHYQGDLKGDRYDAIRICIGEKLFEKLSKLKVFMVGVGAIGCELLKNFALLGIGTAPEGTITITDPDVIETSNLNRQFLFREKHLRKPKSQTAAASVIQMNKDLKGKIHARLDKVHPGTAHIFTDKFFEEIDVVANALDNVQARRYIDLRCVKAKTPLLESGTLGPKGHVQVIVPYKTESYSSQEDPQDDHEIPHCTLKMFPEETLHCVEWARDKFGKLFTQKPKSLAKLIEDPNFTPTNMQELQTLKQAVKLLKNMPTNFDDCIRFARNKFQKYFVNDIRQLLFTYPLEHKTKQGTPFWASPKRPPTEISFDPKNLLHASFIVACASLWATLFEIPFPNDCWKDQVKLRLAQEAAEIKVKDFKPSNDKAKALTSEVEIEEKKQAQPDEIEEKAKEKEHSIDNNFVHNNEFTVYKKEFDQLVEKLPKNIEQRTKQIVYPQEFEKDNDKNFHIDFIYSLANCRASNYNLESMDWITVKLKAGRIVPALATTTASVAGLQTIELCKVVNENKIEDIKNAFLNFAVPYLTLSEPGPVKHIKLTEKLTVSVWDRWEISLSNNAKLKDLFTRIIEDYQLECQDVMYEGKVIYLHNIMDLPGREIEKEKVLKQELRELLDVEDDTEYADLTITFSKKGEKKILDNTPEVRVFLK